MNELPSGTVTLLFTDIGGSTERWERVCGKLPLTVLRSPRLMP